MKTYEVLVRVHACAEQQSEALTERRIYKVNDFRDLVPHILTEHNQNKENSYLSFVYEIRLADKVIYQDTLSATPVIYTVDRERILNYIDDETQHNEKLREFINDYKWMLDRFGKDRIKKLADKAECELNNEGGMI